MLDFYAELRELATNREKIDESKSYTLRVKVTDFQEATNFIDAINQIAFVEYFEKVDKTSIDYYTDLIFIDVDAEVYFYHYDIFENILL